MGKKVFYKSLKSTDQNFLLLVKFFVFVPLNSVKVAPIHWGIGDTAQANKVEI